MPNFARIEDLPNRKELDLLPTPCSCEKKKAIRPRQTLKMTCGDATDLFFLIAAIATDVRYECFLTRRSQNRVKMVIIRS